MFHVGVRRILFDHRTSESLERKGLHSYQSELFFRNNNPCAILLSSFVACFACSENQTEECKLQFHLVAISSALTLLTSTCFWLGANNHSLVCLKLYLMKRDEMLT